MKLDLFALQTDWDREAEAKLRTERHVMAEKASTALMISEIATGLLMGIIGAIAWIGFTS